MGNCRKSKLRVRLERKEEWSRHTFEVTTGIVVIKETTWSQPNAHVAKKKKHTSNFESQPKKEAETRDQNG